ncbi:MAG: endolytic transglycosylase MltG [Coxiellaceae bacterium]|jgi:UPF0755 protein|nr:endolytic transglycosylase MltG [Coxiellaceae bacterium]
MLVKLYKKLLIALILIVSLGIGLTIWFFLTAPLIATDKSSIHLIFPRGASVRKMAYLLQEKNLIERPNLFITLVSLSGIDRKLQAGEYLIEPGTTLYTLITKMIRGDTIRHAFTIIEGWNFQQVIAALNSNQHLKHTITKLKNEEIMENIGYPNEIPEGRFAPDTYLFSGEITDISILRKSYKLMQVRLDSAWKRRDKNTSYHCPYEALIVASLIEKETALTKEKPIIAGIILRRLEQGMLLQLCPSVIYGLKHKFTGKLTKTDLLRNTLYNTYIHKGLPPSPIAMPSKESIEAALHPIFTKALYYVSKGDGSHEFSVSLEDHNLAINKYLRTNSNLSCKTRDNKIKSQEQQLP